MLEPTLLTLFGEETDDPRLGWIAATIMSAITNVFNDVVGVQSGTEDIKTALLNTFTIPILGKYLGEKWWPVKNAPAPAAVAAPVPGKLAQLPDGMQQALTTIGAGIPFLASLAFQMKKGISV